MSWATIVLDVCFSLLLQSIGNIDYVPIYNINIWKVNDVSNRFPSVQASFDGESSDGGRLLQVTNTCDMAAGGHVQWCDRRNSGQDFLPSFAGLAVLVQKRHRGVRRGHSR